jgi:Domain of unknown function (DUF5666)
MRSAINRLHPDVRSWLNRTICALALVALSSCGGGGLTAINLPGTGGTGIVGPSSVTAMGPLNGFGSVIVNGIKFDESGADVRIDDLVGDSGSLRLGMTAKVIGSLAATTPSASPTASAVGVANSIEIWSAAQGLASNIQLPSTVTVAGMTLVVDAGTVFFGVDSLAGLSTDSVVKVWGLPSSVDYSQWTITRLEVLKPTLNTVSTGKVVAHGRDWILNGMTLANAPDGLVDGQLIRVQGTLSGTTDVVLTVTKATVLAEAGSTSLSTGYAATQGIVSSILSTQPGSSSQVTRLTLGASVVDISKATVLPAGTLITEGMRLQVHGEWNAGTLVASQVKFISEQDLKAVDVEGVIEAKAGNDNMTVRGQRFDASSFAATQEELLGQLRVGVRVRFVGVKTGTSVLVSSIEIK